MARLKAIAVLLVFCSQALLFPLVGTARFALQAQSGSKFVLEDGTPIKLRLSRTISSADETVGNQVDLEVVEELQIGNKIVIPKGSVALGTVTDVQAKRRMGRGGKLDVNIDTVRLANGQKAALRAVKNGKGGSHTGAMTGAIVATSLVLWPAAPLFLLMHGKDITIPKGTQITAYVEGNMNLDARAFHTEAGQDNPVAVSIRDEGEGAGAGLANIAISSTPAGAEILLDQSFVGNTPSSLSVTAGEHLISVKKMGYQDWDRKIRVSGGNVNLAAELVKSSDVPVAAPSTKPTATTLLVQESLNPNKINRRENARSTVSVSTPSGWIGVSTKRAIAGGAIITSLVPQGPAAIAGLRVGDTILKLNGNLISDEDLESQITSYKAGSKVAVTYMRDSWASIAMITVGTETL
jgi:hypothetical protein